MNSNAEPKRVRAPFLVGGVVAALFAFVALAVGGAALWGQSQKDDDGYLSTATHRYAADTRAVVSDDLDLDIDEAGLIGAEDAGKIRLKADSQTGKPVFIGIARTSEFDDSLRGVAHTTVTDVDFDPFV